MWFLFSLIAWADPCGMGPPLTVPDARQAIQRTGAQRTYVMFRDGIETIALRPGFEGDVADFGMLIPFPSPPAIRKIADDTFKHLEGADMSSWLEDYGLGELWEKNVLGGRP